MIVPGGATWSGSEDDQALYRAALIAAEAGELDDALDTLAPVLDAPEGRRWELLYLAAWVLLHHVDDDDEEDEEDEVDDDDDFGLWRHRPERDQRVGLADVVDDAVLRTAAELLEDALVLAPSSATRPAELLAAVRERQGDHVASARLMLRALSRKVVDAASLVTSIEQVGRVCALIAGADAVEVLRAVELLVPEIDGSPLPEIIVPEVKAELHLAAAQRLARLHRPNEADDQLRLAEAAAPSLPVLAQLGERARVGPSSKTGVPLAGLDVEGSIVREIFDTLDVLTGQLGHPWSPSDPRALLLFGPSGTGKTHIVRAYAAAHPEMGYRKAQMDRLFGRYVGESEKAISEFLRDIASNPGGGVAFLDEIDALGGERDQSEGQWQTALVGHVLAEIDTFKETVKHAALVGGTNRIWAIDHAVLRRFDEIVLMPLPSRAERRALFRTIAADADMSLSEEALDRLADASASTSPADCTAAFSGVRARHRQLEEDELVRMVADRIVVRRASNHLPTWVARSREKLSEEGFTDLLDRLEELYGDTGRDDGIRIEAQEVAAMAPLSSGHLRYMSHRVR